jgi:hypothetical protein
MSRPEPAKAAHTLGPWIVTSIRALSVAQRENGLRICTLNSDESKISEETRQANAELIAAAPGMAAELERVTKERDSLLKVVRERDDALGAYGRIKEELERAKAAQVDALVAQERAS